eukprot:13560743-Alexandrium_andersonii.AAC.1
MGAFGMLPELPRSLAPQVSPIKWEVGRSGTHKKRWWLRCPVPCIALCFYTRGFPTELTHSKLPVCLGFARRRFNNARFSMQTGNDSTATFYAHSPWPARLHRNMPVSNDLPTPPPHPHLPPRPKQ